MRQGRHRAMELLPESIEGPKRYSLPDRTHQVKVIAKVMHRVEYGRAHLPCHVQVSQVGPGVTAARVAPAVRIQRAVVIGMTGISDVDPAFAGEELPVPGVPRGHHA